MLTAAAITALYGYTPANATSVATNTANISTNTSNIASNTSLIATKVNIIDTSSMLSKYSRINSLANVATSGLYNDLSGKPTIPTVSGTTGTYGITTIANGLVTSGKRQEIYSGTTNASGIYTVTFSNAFSVPPNIQASIPTQSATNQYLRISAVSTTGFTVNAYAFNTNTLLGIVSLVTTTSAITNLPVDVLITEK